MRPKQLILELLTASDLRVLANTLGIRVGSRDLVDEVRARFQRRSLDEITESLRLADLKTILGGIGLSTTGNKDELLGQLTEVTSDSDDLKRAVAFLDGDESAWDDDEEDDLDDEDSSDEDDDDEDEGYFAWDDDEQDVLGDAYGAAMATEFACLTSPPQRRPYQDSALDAVWPHLKPGSRPLLHIATGGGKTLVANDIIVRWQREDPTSRSTVLWITKDWRLLHQSAGDLCRRHDYWGRLSRIGGDGSVLHPLPTGPSPVRYTTIQTLSRRLDKSALVGVGLVIWDECHWGEHGKAGRAILRELAQQPIALLGLTATPRPSEKSHFQVAYTKSFSELVHEKWLAKPCFAEPIRTGIGWNPQRLREGADFTRGSLVELAKNKKRNELIVKHYVDFAERYGQTIMFACTKEHATKLAKMLCEHGIPARAIHSDNADSENREYLAEFKRKAVRVVVNVEMLTHGIDVPSARTVFLARPTLSDILYSQMVGRASRPDRESGKTTFNVVEFTDNLERFGEDLRTAKVFFAGAPTGTAQPAAVSASREPVPSASLRNTSTHRYDPNGAPTWIPDDPSLPEAMRGLWLRKGQTFGFEIEVTEKGLDDPGRLHMTPRWYDVAASLREALASRLPGRVAPRVFEDYQGIGGAKSYTEWNIEYDGSVGWEVTSRILADEPGYAEVVAAADAIDAVVRQKQLHINHKTGLHLHLAWRAKNPKELQSFLRLARLFEPALATLVPPSRIAQFDAGAYRIGVPNTYCKPISTVISGADIRRFDIETIRRRVMADGGRFTTVNLQPLLREDGISTIEIRMHGGTTEARKMLLWLSLWQQILWAASVASGVPDVPDRAFLEPDSDILTLARSYLPSATQLGQQTFLRKLAERRAEVVGEWAQHPELGSWSLAAARWASDN